MLIDIGVNLMHPTFDDDRARIVADAAVAGVSPLVITGSSEATSRSALKYAALFPGKLYATAGVHPHEAGTCDSRTIDALRELAVNMNARAIGECGLDYNRDYSPRAVQRKCFEKQLALAAELKLPVFLHQRDAHPDFIYMLRNFKRHIPRAVVHCFTGTGDELEAYLDVGCYIGITGWICDERRGRHLASLVKKIPHDRLLLETDSPFLTPRNMYGVKKKNRNAPENLGHIAAVVSVHIGKDLITLARETYVNSKLFFNLP